MQEKIKYSDIKALGFKEMEVADSVYFAEFGYPYTIITLNLTKKIYLDWAKETQLCEMIRLKNTTNGDIAKRMPINNLNHLKEIVDFYSDNKVSEPNNFTFAA